MSTTTADPTPAGAPERGPARKAAVHPVAAVLRPLASLQLTVFLFALSILLVFFGTVAQKNAGIWTVVDQYFWSWVVWVDMQLAVEVGKIFFGLPPEAQAPSWAKLPFPAGKLIGGLMFVNLLAAHLVRFKLSWRRTGVVTLHAGILLLFVGEFVTREYQVEQQMPIWEGESSNYTLDSRSHELAFVHTSEGDRDIVTVVPASLLKDALRNSRRVQHPDLPVDVEVLRYMPNSDLVSPAEAEEENPADAGAGLAKVAVERPEVTGVDQSELRDVPSAYVRFYRKGTDEPLGTYLVSVGLNEQKAEFAGKAHLVSLRNIHYYKPFRLHLKDFEFKRYPGTAIAKDYTSHLQLIDPETGQDRPVTIRMNEPLRYRGETFYQSGVLPGEKGTILQVVRNPGWVLPYVSCGLVTVGMLLHFGLNLGTFLTRMRRQPRPAAGPPRSRSEWVIPAVSISLAALYVLGALMPRSYGSKMDLAGTSRLPVLKDGRVKPLGTVARVNLRQISHREEATDKHGDKVPAIKWYLDAATASARDLGAVGKMPIFRIENEQLLDLMKVEHREGLRYSLEELRPRFGELEEAARKAADRPKDQRDRFEVKVLELHRHLGMLMQVMSGQDALILPPGDGKEWRTPADAAEQMVLAGRTAIRNRVEALELPDNHERWTEEQRRQAAELIEAMQEAARRSDPSAVAWEEVLAAYRSGEADRFNRELVEYSQNHLGGVTASDLRRVRFEAFLNDFAPFYHCTALYVLAFLLGAAGWVALLFRAGLGEAFRRGAFWVLVLTFAVHTFSLLSRMYVMERPLVFVTNLYSSAVFIGWAAVGICLVVERIFPIGLGNVVAAALGFATSVVAHNLAADGGDTLEMMVAVLDTNFWLATHVTTVTLGYSATFIAGAVGLMYVLLGVFTPALRTPVHLGAGPAAKPMELGRAFGQVMYGIVCLATLLSFVGTVLGGIWADQSWGRFWGWDPKENGAVLIVIWNALILHARWAGLVKDRGVAVLALVGSMITTWSWFGTNQLGVGLHNYGFNNALATGCMVTWVVHLGFVSVGLIPTRYWRSFASTAPQVAAR